MKASGVTNSFPLEIFNKLHQSNSDKRFLGALNQFRWYICNLLVQDRLILLGNKAIYVALSTNRYFCLLSKSYFNNPKNYRSESPRVRAKVATKMLKKKILLMIKKVFLNLWMQKKMPLLELYVSFIRRSNCKGKDAYCNQTTTKRLWQVIKT